MWYIRSFDHGSYVVMSRASEILEGIIGQELKHLPTLFVSIIPEWRWCPGPSQNAVQLSR